MKVAIVGGGLVGRIAAWGVMQVGHCPVIYDQMYDKIAKTPRGFVYEHSDLDLPLTPQKVWVTYQGTAEEYAKKVYNGVLTGDEVSFGKWFYTDQAYDPGDVLNWLNGLQHGMVVERGFEDMAEILELRETHDRVIFTLPLNRFVKGNFPSVRGSVGAWKVDPGEVLQNHCVYNSNPDIPWYRSGAMFGWAFREFSKPIINHQPIVKVMPGDGPPEHENVLFTGRFGRWDKGELSHLTYDRVIKWLL